MTFTLLDSGMVGQQKMYNMLYGFSAWTSQKNKFYPYKYEKSIGTEQSFRPFHTSIQPEIICPLGDETRIFINLQNKKNHFLLRQWVETNTSNYILWVN